MGQRGIPPRVARRAWTVPALSAVLLVAVVTSSSVGSVPISLAEIGALLLQRLGLATASAAVDTHAEILFAIRLPRVMLGVLVGAGLGLSGASMQGIFRNPLVDPGLLGISTGAALGAVASIVLGGKLAHGIPPALAPYVLPAAAFAGALVAMTAVERIARVGGRMVVATLLLAGIAVNALASALTGLLIYASNDAQLRTITFWSLGSLGGATSRTVVATAAFLGIPLLLLVRYGRALNALLLGEAEAGHLGVDVERTKRTMIVLVALIVGAAVAVSGVLGFVGLVVPHLLRLAVGPDHRQLLAGSALLGASLLLGADAVARTLVSPAELPLGIVTAALGTPFFLALLLRERRRLA
ncbi:MAG: iron ABC transporter permease [Labilithrix sp.]|nr:iron ABC transporter permease [Labilithrix sp.]